MADEVIDAPLDGGNPADAQNNGQPPAGGEDTLAGGDKSLADGGGKETPTAPSDWPEDWRKRMSGEDADALKRLDRYKSPIDVAKALSEAQKKISSGQMKPQLPKDATDEDIAAYRKEIGVPDKPEGYLDALPDGLVVGEDDKELASSFLESAHAANMPPEFVGAALDWYYKSQEEQIARTAEDDKSYRGQAEDELRGEWGGEFRVHQSSVKNFLNTTPVVGKDENGKDVTLGDIMRGARSPDGRLMGDNPHFLRWIADLANKANPAGFVAPGSGDQAKAVDAEIAEIEEVMRTKRDKYDKDDKMQARYLQLLEARDKLAS